MMRRYDVGGREREAEWEEGDMGMAGCGKEWQREGERGLLVLRLRRRVGTYRQ